MMIDSKGKIKRSFHPAVYLDTSVLVDYWLAEDVGPIFKNKDSNDQEHIEVVRGLLRADKRLRVVRKIRDLVVSGSPTANIVTSPLAIIELSEWYADSSFRQIASSAAGAFVIQRKGKKDIGDLLAKVVNLRMEEVKIKGELAKTEETGLKYLMKETFVNAGFMRAHGLHGVNIASIKNFDLDIKKCVGLAWFYACLQVGMADIMHILIAEHLGCKYIASFDSDFVRARDNIAEYSKLILVSTPDELLNVLKGRDLK